MAAPNIVEVSTITGVSTHVVGIFTSPGAAGQGAETGISTIVSNAAGSGKVIKINSITATAIGATTGVTLKYFDKAGGIGNSVSLGTTISVPMYSSLLVISKEHSLYLEENRSIGAHAQPRYGTIDVVCSYEEIS
tara:strand:- start:305 stop:709 length:405 start_codon:yes stop_codon:yes gene_type:complete